MSRRGRTTWEKLDPSKRRVPFDGNGRMVSAPEWGMRLSWELATPFQATLRFDHWNRMRGSGVNAAFVDDRTGREYVVFLRDLEDLLRRRVIAKGAVRGTWTYVKRGRCYGVREST